MHCYCLSDYSIQRMIDTRWNKARRGELMTIPPAGYDLDDMNQLVVTPDESVAHAIRTVFAKLDELGTARQVMFWWRQQKLKYPVILLKCSRRFLLRAPAGNPRLRMTLVPEVG
jgi:hypothetical protein